VVVLVVVSALAFIGFSRFAGSITSAGFSPAARALPSSSSHASTGGIPCDQLEHTQVHYHVGLQILNQGETVPISTGVGRTVSCFYWLHMHTGEPGIIHVEAPANNTFNLGDFFSVWGAWSGFPQLLDATHVSTVTLHVNQKLLVYVDTGAGPAIFTGDPRSIVLKNREEITLEITPPTVNPPPAFPWPPGF
jgi:hypothetical protein